MMRILYDHQIFLAQPFGGISRYFAELIRSLSFDPECRIDVSAFCVSNEYLNALFSFSWLKGHLRKNIFARKLSSLLNQTCATLAVRSGQFDIFHPTYYNPYFLASLKSRPFVVTIYDMTHELFPECFAVGDPTSERKRLLVERAAHVIAISHNTKKDLVRLFGVAPEKVTVTHLSGGFSSDFCSEPDSQWAFLSNERYLLFVGKREGYKNFNGFISAIVPLLTEDRSLKVFCVGGTDFTPKEQALIKGLGISDQVRSFMANDMDLMHFYRWAVAFVFPSFYEGFGIPVLEAFSCECPVIISNSSSLPEVGGDAAVYFDPHNKVSIFNAVRRVVSDSALRLELKKKILAHASMFSWQKTAEETKQIYRKVLGQKY